MVSTPTFLTPCGHTYVPSTYDLPLLSLRTTVGHGRTYVPQAERSVATELTIVIATNRLTTRTTHVSTLACLAGAGAGRLTSSHVPRRRATPCRRGGVGAPSPSTPPSSSPLSSSPLHAASSPACLLLLTYWYTPSTRTRVPSFGQTFPNKVGPSQNIRCLLPFARRHPSRDEARPAGTAPHVLGMPRYRTAVIPWGAGSLLLAWLAMQRARSGGADGLRRGTSQRLSRETPVSSGSPETPRYRDGATACDDLRPHPARFCPLGNSKAE